MSRAALLAFSLAALAGMAGPSAADVKGLESGLQPGDKSRRLQSRDISGANKGKSLCYV
jgi:hypothetical protein